MVHFYPAADSDPRSLPDLGALDPVMLEEPVHLTRDVRDFLPAGHLMDDVGLTRNHDGRHPRALEGMLHTFITPTMLGMVCSILDTIVETLRLRVRPFCVRVLCTHGRHRSVAAAVVLAKVFRLILGIAAVAYVNIGPDSRGRSRLCTAGHCCPACEQGPSTVPCRGDLHLLLHSLLDQIRRRRRQAVLRRSQVLSLWQALECMVD